MFWLWCSLLFSYILPNEHFEGLYYHRWVCWTSRTPQAQPTWTPQWCTGGGRTAGAKTRSTRTSSGDHYHHYRLLHLDYDGVHLCSEFICEPGAAKGDKVRPDGQEEERCIYKLAFPLIWRPRTLANIKAAERTCHNFLFILFSSLRVAMFLRWYEEHNLTRTFFSGNKSQRLTQRPTKTKSWFLSLWKSKFFWLFVIVTWLFNRPIRKSKMFFDGERTYFFWTTPTYYLLRHKLMSSDLLAMFGKWNMRPALGRRRLAITHHNREWQALIIQSGQTTHYRIFHRSQFLSCGQTTNCLFLHGPYSSSCR